jgi:plastocyanin
MVKRYSIQSICAGLCFLSLSITGPAIACLNTGTAAPCHCIENMMMAITRSGEPVVTPTLSSGIQAPASTQGVHVGSNYYTSNSGDPFGNVTITAGDTIEWVFDAGNHTVTSTLPQNDPQYFDSMYVAQGGTIYSHLFNTPGQYTYYCQLHSFSTGNGNYAGPQVGTITVVAAPEPAGLGFIAVTGLLALRRNRKQVI